MHFIIYFSVHSPVPNTLAFYNVLAAFYTNVLLHY
jgi:hypothetical protein